MKRINNLFPQIYDHDNIDLADRKARKCKKNTYGVKKHDENREQENLQIHENIKNGTYKTSGYSTFKIYEPKERIIFRLPYNPDRIVHHAVMNILEPIWVKTFTRDTYSCIKNRGIHALAQQLRKDLDADPQGTLYCLKMDIKKFYPSINHAVLKRILKKKIKDKKLLKLLGEVIDSADGVPIGNYLSQFFANLYMAYFDHWVKEELKVKYYYRYADDIVILSDNKNQLRSWLVAIKLYLTHELQLKLKDNYQIFPVNSRGIDFVGYVFYHTHTKLRKSIKMKLHKLIDKYEQGKLSKEELQIKLASYFGWLKYCDSKNLLRQIYLKTGIKYSRWNGKDAIISHFYGKRIYVVNVETRNKYYLIQFIYKGVPYQIKSRDSGLFFYLNMQPYYPIIFKLQPCLKSVKQTAQLNLKNLSL